MSITGLARAARPPYARVQVKCLGYIIAELILIANVICVTLPFALCQGFADRDGGAPAEKKAM